eukprot:236924_1
MSGASTMDSLDTLPSDLPKLSVSASSPFIPKTNASSADTPTNPLIENKTNLKSSLPLSLLFTTSNNTTLSLQLSELIETAVSTTSAARTPKQVKFKFDEPAPQTEPSQDYIRGDLVIVSPNKQGLIRYIGPLHGDAHTWYGIELIGGTKGFNDGSFQGQRYFSCALRQGIFIKKHQIARKMNASDFENAKPKRPKTTKHKRASTAVPRKQNSLTDIDFKRAKRKPGPREIGRITSTDWTPIEDGDRILEQHKGKFLDERNSRSRQRKRPKTAKYANVNTNARTRSNSSRHEQLKARSKVRINKSETLIPDSFIKLRSKTPTPSRHGLIHGDKTQEDIESRTTPKTLRVIRSQQEMDANETGGRTRSSSSQKAEKRGKKKRKGSKDKRNKGTRRSRSKTVQMNRSDMTKSKSLPERRQPMITFSFEPQTSNAGFPDIAKLGDQKSDNTTMRKKKKRGRKGKHAQSKSTSACGEDQPMVIIRVSSEKNVDRRLLGGRGLAMDLSPKNSLLNMSETTTIPMTDAKESDDLLFAEVNAEIEQRKSGLIDLEQQLDALGME